MSADIGEAFVDYALDRDIRDASAAGVFEMSVDSEEESRHVSELKRRIEAFDDKETFVAVKTLITNRWETFRKSIEYLEKKGE